MKTKMKVPVVRPLVGVGGSILPRGVGVGGSAGPRGMPLGAPVGAVLPKKRALGMTAGQANSRLKRMTGY